MANQEKALSIAPRFRIPMALDAEPLVSGHINHTFILSTAGGVRYLLQKINKNVFKDPPALMENVQNVTRFLTKKIREEGGDPARETLTVVPTIDGELYTVDDEGEYWRLYRYIEHTITYQEIENPEIFKSAGWSFGHFQRQLADYPADQLHETIPHFHDTVSRYADLMKAEADNLAGRRDAVQPELDFAKAHEKLTHYIVDGIEDGTIPLRVTHNDTKLNNILMDDTTGKGVCIVDLDTVMPGSVLYDFGDSIRFGASSAAEDETDLSKVYMKIELFEAFAEGFLTGTGNSLTEAELKALPYGAMVITIETGLRFLTDHLNGDTYFAIHREGQNLDRARTQFKLVADMEQKLPEMNAAIEKIRAKLGF